MVHISRQDRQMPDLGGRLVTKMNGIGNEIVILDLRGAPARVSPDEARAIHRAEGLAFDQLMALHDPMSGGTDAFMRIYNADGSESAACGNGTRCVAWLLTRADDRRRLTLETAAGRLDCRRVDATTFSVDMGRPRWRWDEIPLRDPFHDTRGIELQIGPIDAPILHTPAVVNMGNPHAIFWVDNVEAYDLARFGPLLENHPIFPERANISLARVVARDHIVLRVWERGAGLTLACGSAACAALVAAARKKLTERRARVSLPGGDLTVEWRESDDHVIMTGPVAFEFEARLDPALFEAAPA
jgi:diaminopimelate epimerase